MKTSLAQFLPKTAVADAQHLIERYPCDIKIVEDRVTKHGDFRKKANGYQQITINRNLNPYRFLLTLVHELAHLATFEQHGRVRPHGVEWKRIFQELILPFLRPDIFPSEVLRLLAKHFKNPKATIDSDIKLSWALKQYDDLNGKNFIFELPLETRFIYKNRVFIKGEKRRTRFGCLEEKSGKLYLFHHHAEVEKVG